MDRSQNAANLLKKALQEIGGRADEVHEQSGMNPWQALKEISRMAAAALVEAHKLETKGQ